MKMQKLYDAYELIFQTMNDHGYDPDTDISEQGETLVMLDHTLDVLDMAMESIQPLVTDVVPF